MRNGYADNEKLAEYVEATPRLARPIIETLTIEASDLKDTFDEFDAADSAGGLSAEFTIFDEGGCRLAGTGADELLSSDRSVHTSADITSLVPPTESPLGVAVVDGEATVKRIRRRGRMIELEPANHRYRTLRIDKTD